MAMKNANIVYLVAEAVRAPNGGYRVYEPTRGILAFLAVKP